MEYKMQGKLSIPILKKRARTLIYLCLSIILIYMLCMRALLDNISPFLAQNLIQSALAATLISLVGGLALDIGIRRAKKH